MYKVNQPWDPLKTCIVGRSYPPEFYSFIPDPKVRTVMEKIAEETEEDYQSLIKVLLDHGVKVIRPNIGSPESHMDKGSLAMPPSTPRDYTAMIGDRFFFDRRPGIAMHYEDILSEIGSNGNEILFDQDINRATIFPMGKNLYCGAPEINDSDVWSAVRLSSWPESIPREHIGKLPSNMIDDPKAKAKIKAKIEKHRSNIGKLFQGYDIHHYDFLGHIDSCFAPVKPGLIISLKDIQDYDETFPGWEIILLDDSKLADMKQFNELKNRNQGKWWVPGEENNDEFTEFVDTYLNHWIGFVEETVFDVNILMLDQKTAVCTNYSDQVLDAFSRHDINPIQVNFRHRYFWDGGIHCITSDIDRAQ